MAQRRKKTPIKGRRRKKSLTALKKDARKVFSWFIRLRDTDKMCIGTCVTCPTKHFWTKADAGHFMLATKLTTCFEEKNVHLQCIRCNRFQEGEQYKHGVAIDAKYGEGTAQGLEELSQTVTKISTGEYKEMILDYTAKVKELIKEKKIEIKLSFPKV